MKAFIGACLILFLLLGGIAANAIMMRQKLDALTDALSALPASLPPEARSTSPDAITIATLWAKAKPLAILTVSKAQIKTVEQNLAALYAGWDAECDALYRRARGDLLLILREIRATESFSLSSIL